MEEALASGHGKITPDELPQSLKEIYNISNKNRWKNKDKKRNRELENAAESAIDTEDCQKTRNASSGGGSDSHEGIEWMDAQNPPVEKTPEGSVSPWPPRSLCHSLFPPPSLSRWTSQFKSVGSRAMQSLPCLRNI
jgi:hypothetical protein